MLKEKTYEICISQLIDSKGSCIGCWLERNSGHGPVLEEKREQATAIQMEFSAKLIIARGRRKSRETSGKFRVQVPG
jgi:hypothetical protein